MFRWQHENKKKQDKHERTPVNQYHVQLSKRWQCNTGGALGQLCALWCLAYSENTFGVASAASFQLNMRSCFDAYSSSSGRHSMGRQLWEYKGDLIALTLDWGRTMDWQEGGLWWTYIFLLGPNPRSKMFILHLLAILSIKLFFFLSFF